MATQNEHGVKYIELTDEHITDIKKNIELFVADNEYWDKFATHSTMKRGHKTFSYRKLIKPLVKEGDISPRAEYIAPRPTKIAVATFEQTVQNYGDKAIYSREDTQYHFDNTVNNITDTLKSIAVQKLDLIKGRAFVSSAATITLKENSLLKTLDHAAITLRKNKVRRWDGKHFLAHLTPEAKVALKAEIEAKGSSLSESVKVQLNGRAIDFTVYGDWMFSETTSEVLYKEDGKQLVVLMGKREIDGQSPVTVSKLEGESNIELINNGLGSGVLEDVDGNLTADDNKQQGSVAINMDGLGAAVNDDLAILTLEVDIEEIKGTALPEAKRTGFVSMSGNAIKLVLSGVTGATVEGYTKHEGGVYYAAGSTLISVRTTSAGNGNWTATYSAGGETVNAEVLSVFKTSAEKDTAVIRVPQTATELTISCK